MDQVVPVMYGRAGNVPGKRGGQGLGGPGGAGGRGVVGGPNMAGMDNMAGNDRRGSIPGKPHGHYGRGPTQGSGTAAVMTRPMDGSELMVPTYTGAMVDSGVGLQFIPQMLVTGDKSHSATRYTGCTLCCCPSSSIVVFVGHQGQYYHVAS